MSSTGWVAAGALVVFTLGPFPAWQLAETETLIAPLACGGILAALSGLPLIAGLLFGLAVTFKTTAVLLILPLAAAVLLARPKGASPLRPLLELAGGSAVVPLLTLGYFAARGGLPYLAELAGTQSEYARYPLLPLWDSLWDMVNEGVRFGFFPLLWVSAPVGAIAWLRKGSVEDRVAAVWWLAGVAQVILQKRFFLYHWLVVLPPAAWLAARALRAMLHRDTGSAHSDRSGRAVYLALAATLGVIALAPMRPALVSTLALMTGRISASDYRSRFDRALPWGAEGAVDDARAAAYLRAHTGPRDGVLVADTRPDLYLQADRFAPTRHFCLVFIFMPEIREARCRAWYAEYFAALEKRLPLYVVTTPYTPPHGGPDWSRARMVSFLKRHYRPEKTFGEVEVWRRSA